MSLVMKAPLAFQVLTSFVSGMLVYESTENEDPADVTSQREGSSLDSVGGPDADPPSGPAAELAQGSRLEAPADRSARSVSKRNESHGPTVDRLSNSLVYRFLRPWLPQELRVVKDIN